MQSQQLQKLQESLKGKTVILAVGNSLKGDDGFGPVLASRIKDQIPAVIDAGTAPENYISTIIRQSPDTVLVIDAADFKGQSGEARLFESDEMQKLGYFSTHSFPLEFIMKFLKQNLQEAQILLLGVQPKTVAFGQGLTQELEEAENRIRNILLNILVKE